MFSPQDILIGFTALLALILALAYVRLNRRITTLTRGKTCTNLEETIGSVETSIKDLQKFEHESKDYFKNLEKRVRRSTQTAETLRFNAFRGDGVGGNQSFATAFLNEDGDGTILSSLYSRDRVSVFSKPVSKFSSEIELSEEERRAISLAKTKLTTR